MMNFKKSSLLLIFSLLLVFLVACGQGGDNDSSAEANSGGSSSGNSNSDENGPTGSISAQGSDTMVNLGQAFAEAYMGGHQGNIQVTGGGTGTGIAAVINDDTDIAQASRAFSDLEIEQAQENGVDVYAFVVGQDGLAVYMHSDNPIDELTVQQIKAIFTGEISNWADLGWEDGGEIMVFSRQSNSGTYVYFNENIMDGEDWAAGANFMPGSAAVVEGVSQDKTGIGYSGIGYDEETVKVANVALDENSEYITPLESDNVNNGLYPIARPLYFYTNGVPEGLVLHYLNWVLKSDEAVEQLNATGFYGIGDFQDGNIDMYEQLGLEW